MSILRQRRIQLGSLAQVARDLGISVSELSAFETGRAIPIGDFRATYAHTLDITENSVIDATRSSSEELKRIERRLYFYDLKNERDLKAGIPCQAWPRCQRLAVGLDGHMDPSGLFGYTGERAWCELHLPEARGAFSVLRGGLPALLSWARTKAGLSRHLQPFSEE